MEIQQLRYFREVAKYGSISRAAEGLNISQPSLSSSIIRLESELGVSLFDRKGRNIQLNDDGAFFLSKVETILSALASSRAAFDRKSISGAISIASRNFYTGIFPVITSFRRQYPDVSFHIYRYSNYERLQVREYDFIIHNQSVVLPAAVTSLFIAKRTYGVMLRKDDPLCGRSTITLDMLRDREFVFKRESNGELEMPHKMCVESGFYPKIAVTINSDAYKIDVIRRGAALGIVTNEWVASFEGSGMVFIPLSGFEGYTNTMISWSEKSMDSPVLSTFSNFLKDWYGK